MKIGGEADVIRHNQRIKAQNNLRIKAQTIKNIPEKNKPKISQSRNKYGNTKTEVNGIKYDSKKEAERSIELEQLEKLGKIKNLERQKKYILQPSFKFLGKTIREISYVADFVYEENSKVIVEDVKSPITRANPVYKLKKKMMMYVHGIEIVEV